MERNGHPGSSADTASNLRFGLFELDLARRELRKEGRRIRLQEQPFQILQRLLESPGEVVSREEIRKRLWPDDTVVEFDHSINVAVRRLRDALRDSADKPRYIETVARRGYRFVAKVDAGRPPEPAAVVPENSEPDRTAESIPTDPRPRWNYHRSLLLIVLAAITFSLWGIARYYKRAAPPSQRTLHPLVRLDMDLGSEVSAGSDRAPSAILSPDGTRLVYVSHSKLLTRQLDQESTIELPGTERAHAPFFSPDGQWVGFGVDGKLKKSRCKAAR
jgi:DNA-binding winged helix-turn-helix (wHTH) protein